MADTLSANDSEMPADSNNLVIGDTLAYQGSIAIGDAWVALRIAE